MAKKCIFFLFLLLAGCASPKQTYRIGIDSTWGSEDFGPMRSYVNGFLSEIFLELAEEHSITFEMEEARSYQMLEGLESKHFDAILSVLPPHSFHLARYDFSENLLDTGPVMVVPVDSKLSKLSQLKKEAVGVIAQDPTMILLDRFQESMVRQYEGPYELLKALDQGEVEVALIPRLLAVHFVEDLYASKLRVVQGPLTDTGIHLITLKKEHSRFLRWFDQRIKAYTQKHKLKALEKKWRLAYVH